MPVQLPKILNPDAEGQAVRVLEHYFKPLEGRNKGFTGGCWDTFDPSGKRAASADVFTADDLVACALLSAPIPGRAAFDLLQERRDEFNDALGAIGPDRDFVELESTEGDEFGPVRALYRLLKTVHEVGETTATKLLARKRPRMVPIVDSVLVKKVFNGSSRHWQPLLEALRADDRRLWDRLVRLHARAELPAEVSVLRVFDVLAWMDGSGNTERAKLHESIVAPDEPAEEADLGTTP